MASPTLSVSESGFERLMAAMQETGQGAAERVTEVLDGYAAPLIRDEIQRLLPSSGRKWSGKRAAARSASPLRSEVRQEGSPALYTTSRNGYHYLYFPDDGSSTRRHAGMQNFMGRGQDAATERIIDRCLAALAEDL